ncbi:hypothetical protein [Bacillus sp. KH172YL63]|uniref:hypothetical protein n=1 Tax=Bacillus sp. KH172YL63 TaxID=2709784 RepID=UPI0013E43FA2|nr:hypothetical protein [Bacillus sp. KH172YL63]BCB03158.1 hypothetical protein KH172YL63_12910 [Bacillus sp. KH172YL63]
MTELDHRGNRDVPDFAEISNHILPAQYNLPLIAIGKNAEGIDDTEDLSYVEGQKSVKKRSE